MSPQEAEQGGLALLPRSSGSSRSWNLVNTSLVLDRVKQGVPLSQALRAGLLGYLQVMPNQKCGEGVWSVAYSAAEKGFGPLIYDIGLSMVHPGWVIPDRFSVSTDALKVWDRYLHGRSDVEKEPLDLEACGLDWTQIPGSDSDLRGKLEDMETVLDDIRRAVRRASAEERETVTFYPWTSKGRSGTTNTLPIDDARTYTEVLEDKYKALQRKFLQDNSEATKTSSMAWKYRIQSPVPVGQLLQNGEDLKNQIKDSLGYQDISPQLGDASTHFFSQKVK